MASPSWNLAVSAAGMPGARGGLAGLGDAVDDTLAAMAAQGESVTIVDVGYDGTVFLDDGTYITPDGVLNVSMDVTNTVSVMSDADFMRDLQGGRTDWLNANLSNEQSVYLRDYGLTLDTGGFSGGGGAYMSDTQFMAELQNGRHDWRNADLTDEQSVYLRDFGLTLDTSGYTAGSGGVFSSGAVIRPGTISKPDGTTVSTNEILSLLRSGLTLATAVTQATASPLFRTGVPLTLPVTLPYAAQVRLPDGTIVNRAANTSLPTGSTILRSLTPAQATAAGVSGGFGSISPMMLLGIGAIGVFAFMQKKKAR